MEVASNDGPYCISKYHPVSRDGTPFNDRYILFQYKSPDYVDMTPNQINYIKGAIDRMEDAFAAPNFWDPEEGYRKYIDVQSFLDYQIDPSAMPATTRASIPPHGYIGSTIYCMPTRTT